MADRYYEVLTSETYGGLVNLATHRGLKLDLNTTKEFVELDSETDGSLGEVGSLSSTSPGWVGLAYKTI